MLNRDTLSLQQNFMLHASFRIQKRIVREALDTNFFFVGNFVIDTQ